VFATSSTTVVSRKVKVTSSSATDTASVRQAIPISLRVKVMYPALFTSFAVSCFTSHVVRGRSAPDAVKEIPANLTSVKSKDDSFLMVRLGSLIVGVCSLLSVGCSQAVKANARIAINTKNFFILGSPFQINNKQLT